MEILIVFFIISASWAINGFKFVASNTLSCGLLGYSGEKAANNQVLKFLFIDNEERGTHSSGVGSLMLHKPAVQTLKSTDKGSVFALNDDTQEYLRGLEIVGHTRYATMGAHDTDNAHPYIFGNIVGTHNGWLIDKTRCEADHEENSYQSLITKFGYDNKELPVDSMLIYKHINESIKTKSDEETKIEAVIRAIESIEGSMALAFIMNDNLHLYRRESKPLYIYDSPTDEGLYYSSRKESFEYAFSDAEAEAYCEMLPMNTLHVIDGGVIIEEHEVAKPKIRITLDDVPSSFYYSYPSFYGRGSQRPVTGSYNRIVSSEQVTKLRDYPNQLRFLNGGNRTTNNLLAGSLLNVFNHPIYDGKALETLGYRVTHLEAQSVASTKMKANDQGVLVIRLVSNNDANKPLQGFKIAIDGDPSTFTTQTSINGCAGVRLTEASAKKKSLKLIITPPSDHFIIQDSVKMYPKSYYKLKLKGDFLGQVSEVTCALAFQGVNREEDAFKGSYTALFEARCKEVNESSDKGSEDINSGYDNEETLGNPAIKATRHEDTQLCLEMNRDFDYSVIDREIEELESPESSNIDYLSLSEQDRLVLSEFAYNLQICHAELECNVMLISNKTSDNPSWQMLRDAVDNLGEIVRPALRKPSALNVFAEKIFLSNEQRYDFSLEGLTYSNECYLDSVAEVVDEMEEVLLVNTGADQNEIFYGAGFNY